MTTLLDLIVAGRRDDPLGAVEHGVFGTTDPASLADEYARWCRSALGSSPRSASMFNVSTGCVAGVELEDGRRVVVKAYPPHRSLSRLSAVLAVQRLAVGRGLPVPAPIAGPEPIGLGWASAEQAMDVGRSPNLLDPRDRATAAARWVQLVGSLRTATHLLAGEGHPRRVVGGLYPIPHSPLFDFEATGAGAEWIDSLATEATAVINVSSAAEVLVQADWRADNIRVNDNGDRLVAIYDWDSIRLDGEAHAIGEVAAMHSIDWSSGYPYFATGNECVEFVRCVECARPAPFTRLEWNAIRASPTRKRRGEASIDASRLERCHVAIRGLFVCEEGVSAFAGGSAACRFSVELAGDLVGGVVEPVEFVGDTAEVGGGLGRRDRVVPSVGDAAVRRCRGPSGRYQR